VSKTSLRCAIYTRVSSDSGLEQDFNSLHAQREAAEAYIKSQAHEGWKLHRERYDDGGFSGGSMERPALQKLRWHPMASIVTIVPAKESMARRFGIAVISLDFAFVAH
jgi:hypothetical protein